jgi:hypothetical protein
MSTDKVEVSLSICYIFELGPTKRVFRDSNLDLRCVTITLNTRRSIPDTLMLFRITNATSAGGDHSPLATLPGSGL